MYLLLILGQLRPLLTDDAGEFGSALGFEVTAITALQHVEKVSAPGPLHLPVIFNWRNALL